MIAKIFDLLAVAFDKIPILNKFKNYRSVIGLVLLAVVYGLDAAGIGGGGLSDKFQSPLLVFTGLALNAKGR